MVLLVMRKLLPVPAKQARPPPPPEVGPQQLVLDATVKAGVEVHDAQPPGEAADEVARGGGVDGEGGGGGGGDGEEEEHQGHVGERPQREYDHCSYLFQYLPSPPDGSSAMEMVASEKEFATLSKWKMPR